MKKMKIYEAGDMMITLIKDNYNLLQSLGSLPAIRITWTSNCPSYAGNWKRAWMSATGLDDSF